MKNVFILMATYNGEKYLEKQIKSIIAQDYENWELFINDDGSSDKSREIVLSLSKRDSRIHFLNLHNGIHGQLNNFRELLAYVKDMSFDYVMFSDQDDIWYKTKIEDTLSCMQSRERGATLIYTNYRENTLDGRVIDRYNKNFCYPSTALFVQNWLMGCTMMINKLLLNMSCDVPDEAENHDNWIMLVALSYGNIFYLDKPTMFHRIHKNNVTNSSVKRSILRKIFDFNMKFKNRKQYRIKKSLLMKCLLDIDGVAQNNYAVVFLKCLKISNKLRRAYYLFKFGFRGLNVHKTIEFLLLA